MSLHPQIQHPAANIEREPFRWLFTAHFSDGSTIDQTEEDKCLTRSDGTGSAFTDVLAREDELVAFELKHVNGVESVLVDLVGGAFQINGTPVHIHNQYFEPTKYKLKLIYFRETRVDQIQKATVQNDMTVTQEDVGTPRHYVNRYFVGWETPVNGKNKQVTLAVG